MVFTITPECEMAHKCESQRLVIFLWKMHVNCLESVKLIFYKNQWFFVFGNFEVMNLYSYKLTQNLSLTRWSSVCIPLCVECVCDLLIARHLFSLEPTTFCAARSTAAPKLNFQWDEIKPQIFSKRIGRCRVLPCLEFYEIPSRTSRVE